MKRDTIIFWISTVIIFLFSGLMPALTSQTELAKQGIAHLGYPEYFGQMLTVAKVLGSLAIILPRIPARVREWAYAGLTFELIAATVSHLAVDGVSAMAFFPMLILVILMMSYLTYHRIRSTKKINYGTGKVQYS